MKRTTRHRLNIAAGVVVFGGLIVATYVVILGASAPSRDSSDPHYPARVTTSEVAAPSTTRALPDPDPGEYHDPAALTDLPYEVQVYVGMARGLVKNGTVPASRVTPAFVQADVSREYGIDLNAAQAEFVVNEITR